MADSADFRDLSQFGGIGRLFPLPNLVLFPHVVQPLHIFEPRYVDLLEDALAGDELIAMSLLRPGWEAEYHDRPPVAPVACLGRIMSHTRLDDGRYNILLVGVRRAHLKAELPPSRSFRQAKLELLDDIYPASGVDRRRSLQRRLVDRFRRLVRQSNLAGEQLEQLLSNEAPLGMLADMAAYTIDLPIACKQRLLEETNVDLRAEQLLEHLSDLVEGGESGPADFPPDFSEN